MAKFNSILLNLYISHGLHFSWKLFVHTVQFAYTSLMYICSIIIKDELLKILFLLVAAIFVKFLMYICMFIKLKHNKWLFLNQACTSLWLTCTWFLKIDSVRNLSMRVCVCPPLGYK